MFPLKDVAVDWSCMPISNLVELFAIADCMSTVSVAFNSPSIYILALTEGVNVHRIKCQLLSKTFREEVTLSPTLNELVTLW